MLRLVRAVALVLCCVCGPAAFAQLTLPGTRGAEVDLWPTVRVLEDRDGALDAGQVYARRDGFAVPAVARANFGARRGALWLWVPLHVPDDAIGRWIVDVDYASLDRVDLWLADDAGPLLVARMGDHVPHAERPLPLRAHAARVELHPGVRGLLLRVETTSAAVVPLRLARPETFYAQEMHTQALQGLAAGIGLCLVLYSLANALTVRDRLFFDYALTVGSTTVFFVAYYGLGPQHLWPGSEWLTLNAAPWTVLIALVGGYLFLDRALDVASISRPLSRCLRAGAALSGAFALALPLGLVDYRIAQLAGTVLGPLPMVLGVPAAYARMRRGDRAAVYMLVGWAGYGAGTVTMALLLRGLVDATPLTLHAFQIGALFEMTMWLFVLGVRVEELRHHAEHVRQERDRMHSLAQSDPLTGLPNRRGLEAVLARSLAQAGPQRVAAVYLLDLDGFKQVNDRLGHDAGDALLVAVARRLRTCVRASDTVARLGGDEFVVVAEGLAGEDDAAALGRKLLEATDAPFDVAGAACHVGLTIGYALAPVDGGDGAVLLKAADAAMYAGKQAGRRQVRRNADAEERAAA